MVCEVGMCCIITYGKMPGVPLNIFSSVFSVKAISFIPVPVGFPKQFSILLKYLMPHMLFIHGGMVTEAQKQTQMSSSLLS